MFSTARTVRFLPRHTVRFSIRRAGRTGECSGTVLHHNGSQVDALQRWCLANWFWPANFPSNCQAHPRRRQFYGKIFIRSSTCLILDVSPSGGTSFTTNSPTERKHDSCSKTWQNVWPGPTSRLFTSAVNSELLARWSFTDSQGWPNWAARLLQFQFPFWHLLFFCQGSHSVWWRNPFLRRITSVQNMGWQFFGGFPVVCVASCRQFIGGDYDFECLNSNRVSHPATV